MNRYRAGVDIGGTFTDLIVVDDQTGAFAVGKALTTPDDPSEAVQSVLVETLQRAGIEPADLQTLVHGTTLVTNAIIERKGARTALLTTQGFRDSTEIGREHRYDLYDLMLEHPRPLVPRYLRFDVPQRTLADGSTLQELDVPFVECLARELAEHGVEAVAIVFLHSFTNPLPERAAREAVQRAAPNMRVSISSDVVPEIREFERASTTIANVFVQTRVERYLRELEARLTEAEWIVCNLKILGYSSEEIAKQRHSSTAAVNMVFSRAKQKLRRVLGVQETGAPGDQATAAPSTQVPGSSLDTAETEKADGESPES